MEFTILSTKLNLPKPRADLVARPRLVELLNAGINRKLTLISAPAGFGKTTLVCEWIHRLEEINLAAWFSIDESDNDPARFVAYFVEALSRAAPELENIVPDSIQPFQINLQALLERIINKIARLSQRIFIVLDDYHLIESPAVHQAIQYILDHQPSQLHLVIATRADPPLRIARFRAQGESNEIRLNELRFTKAEAGEFFDRMMGIALPDKTVDAINDRAEGWVAGLQMAAITMRIQGDSGDFVKSFTGSNRFILDYLSEEVLQRQRIEVQDFLLKTSILERLCGPLCEKVWVDRREKYQDKPELLDARMEARAKGESPDVRSSSEILSYLERSNLFLVPLDDRREWYRYHQLFADLLRARLQQLQPEQIPRLHHRASQWFERNGYLPEAIEHAFAAQDFQGAARLVAQAAEATLMRSEVMTLTRWLDMLPEEQERSYPLLFIFHAWALLLNGRPLEEIQSRMEIIGAKPESLIAKTFPLYAFLAMFRGDFGLAMELSRQALDNLEDSEIYLRSAAHFVQSLSLLSEGDPEEGLYALEQTVSVCLKTGNTLVGVMALCSLAENYKKFGFLHKAYEIYQQAMQMAVDVGGARLPIAGRAFMGVSDILWEWNELGRAEQIVKEGIEIFERIGQVGMFQGYLCLAHIKQSQGDASGAREAAHKAKELVLASDFTVLDDLMAAMVEAQLAIAQGDLPAAMRWVEDRRLLEEKPAPLGNVTEDYIQEHFLKYEQVLLAQLWLAQNRPGDALGLLDSILPRFERTNRPVMIIKVQVIRALALAALGDEEKALSAASLALSLAEPEGYVRTFLDGGEEIARLLRMLNDRKSAPRDYLEKLLAAFGKKPYPAPLERPSAVLEETLSEREWEVLRLLNTELSSAEIAEELVVSVHTVRSHVKRIYQKLNVHSRFQAIAKAKEMKLI